MTYASGLAVREIQAQLIAEALLSAGVGFLVWDEDRKYVAANDTACEILGATLEQLLGQTVGGHTEGGDAAVAAATREERAAGTATVERFDGSGPVEIGYVTFATATAGMQFMATVIWRAS